MASSELRQAAPPGSSRERAAFMITTEGGRLNVVTSTAAPPEWKLHSAKRKGHGGPTGPGARTCGGDRGRSERARTEPRNGPTRAASRGSRQSNGRMRRRATARANRRSGRRRRHRVGCMPDRPRSSSSLGRRGGARTRGRQERHRQSRQPVWETGSASAHSSGRSRSGGFRRQARDAPKGPRAIALARGRG